MSDNYIGEAIQASALAALLARLERRIHKARAERDRVDEACRRAARLAVFGDEDGVWAERCDLAWAEGRRLDQKIEALEAEARQVQRQQGSYRHLAA